MASITLDSFVPTIQLEATTPVVIEVPNLPISGVVTVRTASTESSPVYVILFVASIADCRCFFLVEVPCMATLAGGGPVLAPQWIRRVVVVLKEQHVPAPFGVTAFTVLGKLPFMLVVFFMARNARNRRWVPIQVPFVTGLAFGCDVLSSQRVLRL
jgi:hypothetical protein